MAGHGQPLLDALRDIVAHNSAYSMQVWLVVTAWLAWHASGCSCWNMCLHLGLNVMVIRQRYATRSEVKQCTDAFLTLTPFHVPLCLTTGGAHFHKVESPPPESWPAGS